MIKIGQIVKTQGHRGEVKIIPLTDNPQRYNELDYVFLQFPNYYKKITLESVKFHKNAVIVKFAEIEDMNAAESLRGLYVCISEDNLMKLPEEHYYIFQIINLDVYENEEYLGKVVDVIQTGSNDVYVVEKDKQKILIPALKSVVKKIDLTSKKMEVELPEGLID